MEFFWIALCGMLGTLCRYGVDRWSLVEGAALFPSTFYINVGGSLVAGILYALGEKGILALPLQSALLVGFCGGFTTFSAYALQTALLFEKNKPMALLYFSLSPVAGLLAAGAAIFLLRRVLG